MFDIVKYTV